MSDQGNSHDELNAEREGVQDQTPSRTSQESDAGDRSDEPTAAEMRKPSTEKDVDEEPKAPNDEHDEPEPSHRATGIGVIASERPDPGEAPL